MPSKESYCYQILKTYSLVVDFDGTPSHENVPTPEDGETYGHWKTRVFGENISNVVLYEPNDPANQTRISTLQNRAGATHLEKMFRSLEKTKKEQKNSAVNAAKEEMERLFTTFPKDTLEDIIADSGGVLEPSVKEFFVRFLDAAEPDVDVEKLISELLKAYNEAVRIMS